MANDPTSSNDLTPTDHVPIPFSAEQCSQDGKIHILLAASGSVATIKLPCIAERLGRHRNVSIRIILTESAAKFLMGQSPEQPPLETLRQIPGVDAIYQDHDEWKNPWTRGMPILHIELRKWAHLLLVAPLSANTMAKMTMGFSDNLLLSVLRAWDTTGAVDSSFKKTKPIVLVAPAMNTAMWNHPITKKQLTILRDEWGHDEPTQGGWVSILYPTQKTLACGDNGIGAMMHWNEIVGAVEFHFGIGDSTPKHDT
ncbi:putative flavoprotein [Aspergillus melleus]|uniref:putative flavoprotein n=1 Tax=Aspergillus melleus TaxID=138277 RepID=UPI001E8D63E5|nr:uncharacterized protein LDX57_006559 [Aspergillus melleus]KAH8428884.1 hypothetical protein LDX57_006559 [Aspergillus melleus]